ncbi:MAG: arginine--tRNA ligase, partial [Bacteroidota bacterium]|nr:arginine--tRNA ligase [Bacteroidota bacterium]
MTFTHHLKAIVCDNLQTLFQQPFSEDDFQINETRDEFEGDYTIVLFSLVKKLKLPPETLAQKLGE